MDPAQGEIITVRSFRYRYIVKFIWFQNFFYWVFFKCFAIQVRDDLMKCFKLTTEAIKDDDDYYYDDELDERSFIGGTLLQQLAALLE